MITLEQNRELCAAVRGAGDELLALWPGGLGASRQLESAQKADGSVVTEADVRSNQLLTSAILDSDSSHAAAQSLARARDLGIELMFLPFRSPQLNPVEHLWRHIKAGVCSNHQFPSIEEEMEAVRKFISALPPRSLQVLSGVTAPDFWIPSLQMRM